MAVRTDLPSFQWKYKSTLPEEVQYKNQGWKLQRIKIHWLGYTVDEVKKVNKHLKEIHKLGPIDKKNL
jgi:hypothetical protein